jgi:hypothetical protein
MARSLAVIGDRATGGEIVNRFATQRQPAAAVALDSPGSQA